MRLGVLRIRGELKKLQLHLCPRTNEGKEWQTERLVVETKEDVQSVHLIWYKNYARWYECGEVGEGNLDWKCCMNLWLTWWKSQVCTLSAIMAVHGVLIFGLTYSKWLPISGYWQSVGQEFYSRYLILLTPLG